MSGSEDEDEDDYYSGKLTCSSCDETSMMRNVEDDIEEDNGRAQMSLDLACKS